MILVSKIRINGVTDSTVTDSFRNKRDTQSTGR